MPEVKNKRILQEIARRWAKSCLCSGAAETAFMDSILDVDEEKYVYDYIVKLGEGLTDKDYQVSTDDLVKEYFEEREEGEKG